MKKKTPTSLRPFLFVFIFILGSFILDSCFGEDEMSSVELDFIALDTTQTIVYENEAVITCGTCLNFSFRGDMEPLSVFFKFDGGSQAIQTSRFSARVCYETPGKYDVTMTSDEGFSITKEDFVCVLSKEDVDADFTAEVSESVIGQPIQFVDNSSGNPNSWQWTFSSGSEVITSTEQNPSIELPEGSWDVTLVVRNDFSESKETKNGFVNVLGYEAFDCALQEESSNQGLLRTYQYNASGLLELVTETSNGSLASRIEYSYNIDRELIETIIRNGDNEIVQKSNFVYSTLGLSSQRLEDISGLITEYNFLYQDSLPYGADLTVTQGTNSSQGEVRYTYDEQVKNILDIEIDIGGVLFRRFRNKYDNNLGLFSGKGLGLFEDRFNQNNLTSRSQFNASGDLERLLTFEYEYGEFGRPLKATLKDEDFTNSTTREETFTYQNICNKK